PDRRAIIPDGPAAPVVGSMLKTIVCFVTLSLMAYAQSGSGTIRGTVTDASGAVIAGAKIALTDSDTNVKRETVSSTVGIYYFGELPPGPYTLAVESAGFRRWSGTLQLDVGQTVVVDPHLGVGSLEATVEVTGAAPTITTEGMQVADVK